MKTLRPGTSVTLRLVVDPADRAAFDVEEIHEVYGTVAMVRHAEQVSRFLLKAGLQAEEEGAGASVSLRTNFPVAVGATVEVRATVTEHDESRMVTDIEFLLAECVSATASVTQIVVDPEAFNASIATG